MKLTTNYSSWAAKNTCDSARDLRVMVIGAHPDDCDLHAGCTIGKLAQAGARVRFVSVTNGDRGHHREWGDPLAKRRFAEAQAAAQILGVENYTILPIHDCEAEPTLELRRTITRLVREFAPHVILTHRTCDYHADHRATGQVVMDMTYLLGVPGWCPETPIPSVMPAVLFLRDPFTVPREMRPDVVVRFEANGAIHQRLLKALSCHESQFGEWLPFDMKIESECPDWRDAAAREAFIDRTWVRPRKAQDAVRAGLPAGSLAEIFEISEYGRPLTPAERAILTNP